MSAGAEATVALIAVCILGLIVWCIFKVFFLIHYWAKDYVHEGCDNVILFLIVGLIYVCTSIIVFLLTFVMTMAAGYGAYCALKDARDWWHQKD